MRAASFACAMNANRVTVHTDASSRPNGRLTAAVMRKAQRLFTTKIPAEIAARARCGLRTAERWKAGKRVMDDHDLYRLLSDKEHGSDFLKAVWDELPSSVQVRFLRQIELEKRIASVEHRRARQERELAQMRLELQQR